MDKQDLTTELLTIARFGVTGVGATCIHITVVWVLITKVDLQPLLANFVAFCSAFLVSFCGNYLWTFPSSKNPRKALKRFIVVAVSGFFLNTILLSILLVDRWFNPEFSAVAAASLVPVLSYIANRCWAFK